MTMESTRSNGTKCYAPVTSTQTLIDKNALVVGGGLAGLATAAALRNLSGFSHVMVLESSSRDSFVSERNGAAIQLGPNGLKALRCIGGDAIVSKIMEEGTMLQGNVMIMPSSSEGSDEVEHDIHKNVMIMPDNAEADTGLPQVLIRWSVLRSILAGLLPQDCIITDAGSNIVGYSCTDGDDGGNYVTPITKNGSTLLDGISLPKISLLVGADGMASTFRALVRESALVLPSDEEDKARRDDLKDNGRVNIKAAVQKRLPETFRSRHTYSYFSPTGGIGCFAGPAGKEHTYWAVSIADTVDEATGEKQRFLSDDNDCFTSSTLLKMDKALIKQKLTEKLSGLKSAECNFVLDLIESTPPEILYFARSEEALNIGPLMSTDSKLVLVGDAAHVISTSYGQAANFAFEDAATLGVFIRDEESLEIALKEYNNARVHRCLDLQKKTSMRAEKALKGEQVEDISGCIFKWNI